MKSLVAAPHTNYRNQVRQLLRTCGRRTKSADGRPQGGKLTQESASAVADNNHGVRFRLTRREGWQAARAEGPARGEEGTTSVAVSFSLSCEYRSRDVWGSLTAANEEVPLAWLSVSKS